MLIRKPSDIASSEITPRERVLDRRSFLAGAGALAGAATLGALELGETVLPSRSVLAAAAGIAGIRKSPLSTSGEKRTPLKDIANYNN